MTMIPTTASFGTFRGWRVKLDAHRAVPTPAVAGGRVLVGGGFGSHDFYAFDAVTGELVWYLRTKDDGPTAAVVSDDYAVFNTESCTLEVVSVKDGRIVAESWLGDPLLGQPAVSGNRVFMVFPAGGEHVLGAFELPSLEPLWRTRISHDVITAPVCAEGKVWLSTFDGSVWCVNQETGAVEWTRAMGATSAPWIDHGRAFVSTRVRGAAHGRPAERTTRLNRRGTVEREHAAKAAPYLDRKWGAAHKAAFHSADAGVGFGQAPAAAKLGVAEEHLGEGLVSRTWRYQGSRPVVWADLLFETIGDRLEARDIDTDAVVWSWDGAAGIDGERRLTPPAVANGRVWAGTWDGSIKCWDARTGEVLWDAPVGAPCHWQPVITGGWVYAGLEDGSLIGLQTGDAAEEGWAMWGGGAGHNGLEGRTVHTQRTGQLMPTTTDCLTCEFEDVGGHVILVLGNTRVLLDTGSPVTLGRRSDWDFLGTPRQLPTGFGPITMDALSDAAGTRIDVLLGTDLLSECAFDIDWPSRRVTFGGPSNGAGHAVPLTTWFGHPVATAEFGGATLQFVVDTGAVVSFLPQQRLGGLPRIGSRRDFTVCPTIKWFNTPLYRAPLTLAGHTLDLQWGELPDALGSLRHIAAGIVGTELFRQYRVRFDLAQGTMWLSNVETT